MSAHKLDEDENTIPVLAFDDEPTWPGDERDAMRKPAQPLEKHKYRVIALDVWGHDTAECAKFDCQGDCDGFEFNNRHYYGEIEVTPQNHVYNVNTPQEFNDVYASDAEILRVLVVDGYLTPDALKKGDVLIDGDYDDVLYLEDARNCFPLLQLERVKEGDGK